MNYIQAIAALMLMLSVVADSMGDRRNQVVDSPVPGVVEAQAVNREEISPETVNYYNYWKGKYVVKDTYTTHEDRYYVLYSGQTYANSGYQVPVTVSEATGYGMLITASMADYDSSAKELFDGMYRYYRGHLSEIGPNLMAWQQSDNGSALVDTSGVNSATDGDMDIAYALLLADEKWGSEGEINYRQTAINIINDIMTYEVNQEDMTLRLGDWTYWQKPGEKYYSVTRPADFALHYMPLFAQVTGDERWNQVYSNTYDIIKNAINTYNTGLLPDFMVKNGEVYAPASPCLLESENDGNYYYNSCRAPWRISMDYRVNANGNAKTYADIYTNFMYSKTGGDPAQLMAGYTPEGNPVANWTDPCFTAPAMVAAGCGDNKTWHDALKSWCINNPKGDYYADTLTTLCLIADEGGGIVNNN